MNNNVLSVAVFKSHSSLLVAYFAILIDAIKERNVEKIMKCDLSICGITLIAFPAVFSSVAVDLSILSARAASFVYKSSQRHFEKFVDALEDM